MSKPKFLLCCPVCGSTDCKPDNDFPDTMENCNHCGAEWNIDSELTFDCRTELTETEVLQKGWFIDIKENINN